MLTELQRYKQRFGDCNVPRRWRENPQLAQWVTDQRSSENEDKLPADRKNRLSELGFVWRVREVSWAAMFAALKRYKEKHGDCNVPRGWGENPELARWVLKQRQHQKQGALSIERKKRLDELGFIWDPRVSNWETMFAQLKQYSATFGHCNAPRGWRDNPQLATWVDAQRNKWRKGVLSAQRKARLDELGSEPNQIIALI
jgi:hypothetical protein